ncbi:MAG TPA: hypothetical protein VNZ57_04605 [Longimicrobiales bacterium]|nr:hypothetical protein [Longimicrobiales bacterium]
MTGKVARFLGVALLGVTFIAGALSGAAFDRIMSRPHPLTGQTAQHNGDSDGYRRQTRPSAPSAPSSEDLFDRIGVTDEQRAAIDEILQRRAEETKSLWADFGPQLEAIVDSTRAEIRMLLTEEQLHSSEWMRIERRLLPGGGQSNGRNDRR